MNYREALDYEAAAPELGRAAIAAAASEAIALTHFCKPRIGFRCWQFDVSAKAIPTWVTNWTNTFPDGRVEFCDHNGSTGLMLDPGDWLVLFDETVDAAVYSANEFAQLYDLVAPAASR